jgi:putative NIF3 family GTP cyclohydrolase 1 type 2
MKIKEIVSALERFAPLPLQDGFDNAGLQIGLTEAEATGALLCLDVTEAVLDEAIALGFDDPKVCRQPNLEVKHKILAALGEEFRQDEEDQMKFYADLFSDFLDG